MCSNFSLDSDISLKEFQIGEFLAAEAFLKKLSNIKLNKEFIVNRFIITL